MENIPGDIVVTVNMNDDIYSFNVPYLDPGDNDTYEECVKDVCIKLSSFDQSSPVTLTSGWYVVDQEVLNFNERITIQFDHEVHIILADNTTLNANKGIFLPSSGSTELHIWGQTHTLKTDGGRLNATSTDRGFPGIGGIDYGGGYLNFHGGYTVARGGEWAAGIQGCPNDVNNRFAIIVSGGYVEGHGGEGNDAVGGGAGIGGNPAQICCSVLITGGCAVGYAGHRAAGIGSGCDGVMHNTDGFSYNPSTGNHSRFYMTGGAVFAVGSTGAGIGGGEGCDVYRGDGFEVRIDGGELYAYTVEPQKAGLESVDYGASAIGWGYNTNPTFCDLPVIYSGAKIEVCSTSWTDPLTTVSYSEFSSNFVSYKQVKISPGD